eukprot:GHVU01150626.1.p1 GENE.GHVU01150626.1~~GHVU01150626.1.p1  ORF type:complete len:173 (-),score=8.68 GHVU01150626.1:83-601(-)
MTTFRALWIFRWDENLRLLVSRRYPTVELRVRREHGSRYVPIPPDEQLQRLFYQQVLLRTSELADISADPSLPTPTVSLECPSDLNVERHWPAGPIASIRIPSSNASAGRPCEELSPVVFVHKRHFVLVAAIAAKVSADPADVVDMPEATCAVEVGRTPTLSLPHSLLLAYR